MAYTTGVLLLVLVFVAMPVKYLGHNGSLVALVGFVHGWAYMVYVAAGLVLTYQARLHLLRTLLILAAGTIPFASFVAERYVVRALARGDGSRPPASRSA